ncbi:hypothetical protein OHB36_07465 [Streptomyces sp. NBC_00320]|uniref:hypothetical protein n=1 Tax=unclassified Streptomyces TaxID=2593676 RepID=UPI000A818F6A|nr:hypothetical protein [Streptomyces sp. NBC_00320]MCX5146630.1 hypothetical protein [Streptomyces sp. NBC_00320]
MRKRLLGFIAALMLAVLGLMGPAAQAAVSVSVPAVDEPKCMKAKGTVEYESATGLWTCIGGTYDGEPID